MVGGRRREELDAFLNYKQCAINNQILLQQKIQARPPCPFGFTTSQFLASLRVRQELPVTNLSPVADVQLPLQRHAVP